MPAARGQGDFTFDAPTLDTFSPLAPLTRQDAVVLLYQYMSALDVEMESASGQLGRFPDGEDTALYARNAMEWAITNQILQGSDGMLLPGRGRSPVPRQRLCWTTSLPKRPRGKRWKRPPA